MDFGTTMNWWTNYNEGAKNLNNMMVIPHRGV
jgi:hypothetical protein